MRILHSRGQSLLELMCAIALVGLCIPLLGMLIVSTDTTQATQLAHLQASLLAQEGIEAMRSIRDYNFGNLTPGIFGLTLVDGAWVLSSYEEGTNDAEFDRTIAIEQSSDDALSMTSTVTWYDKQGKEHVVSEHTLITNWKQNAGDATYLSANLEQVYLSEDMREIRDIVLLNSSDKPITITALTLSWESSSEFSTIHVNGLPFFEAQEGGNVTSPLHIDSNIFSISPFSMVTVGPISFTDPLPHSSVLLQLTLSDGNQKSIRILI